MPQDTETSRIDLADGRHRRVPAVLAELIRGVDADGDLLVPLGSPESPIQHADGSDYLIALTPCCAASATGSPTATGVACRHCHAEVPAKYGGPSTVAICTTHRQDRPHLALRPPTLRALQIAATGGHSLLIAGDEHAEVPLTARWLYHLLPDLTAQQQNAARRVRAEAGDTATRAPAVPPLRLVGPTISVDERIRGHAPEITPAEYGLLVVSDVHRCPPEMLQALQELLHAQLPRTTTAHTLDAYPARATVCAITRARRDPGNPFPGIPQRVLRLLDVRLTAADQRGGPAAPTGDVRALLAAAAAQVIQARHRAAQRWARHAAGEPLTNATAPAAALRAGLDPDITGALDGDRRTAALSARGGDAVLRLAYSAADLDATALQPFHVTEALHLRGTRRRP